MWQSCYDMRTLPPARYALGQRHPLLAAADNSGEDAVLNVSGRVGEEEEALTAEQAWGRGDGLGCVVCGNGGGGRGLATDRALDRRNCYSVQCEVYRRCWGFAPTTYSNIILSQTRLSTTPMRSYELRLSIPGPGTVPGGVPGGVPAVPG